MVRLRGKKNGPKQNRNPEQKADGPNRYPERKLKVLIAHFVGVGDGEASGSGRREEP